MKPLFFVIALGVLCSAGATSQPGPTLTGTIKAGGVQSRNMELVDIIPFRPGSGDQFDVIAVPYDSNGVNKKKQLLVTVHNESAADNRIRILDVTDPRHPNGNYITFIARDFRPTDGDDGSRKKFERIAVYTDARTPAAGTFNGDVFMVAWVHELQYGPSENNDKARFIIINLSKALSLRVSDNASNAYEIEIYNAGQRNVKHKGTKLSPPNRDIYIGYVEDDQTFDLHDPHTLGYDQKSGILTLPTIAPTTYNGNDYTYVDMFDMKQIVTVCTPGVNTLGVLEHLTMSSGAPVTIPPVSTSPDKLLYPHDIVPHYLTDTKVRLFIGSTTGGDPSVQAGGIGIVDVDYSNSTATTVTSPKHWEYDMDRAVPHKRLSDLTDWSFRQTHTAAPFYHTDEENAFVVTADEFFGARYNLYEQANHPISNTSGRWTGGLNPIMLNATNTTPTEDDRRLGAFVRVWNTIQDNGEIDIDGTGEHDGPLSLYDPIESNESENLYFSSRTQVQNQSIEISCTTTTADDIAPNTVHRVHTVSPFNTSMYERNNNDVIVSAYAAGCRVFNLGSTLSDATVAEKAFFDFIPTLNYNKDSEYFYKVSSGGAFQLWQYQHLTNLALYFWGVWNSVPDFGTARVGVDGTGVLPQDEKFIHVMAFGEGEVRDDPDVSTDLYTPDPAGVPDARNWLSDGGFMVLRYFDGELGGTIKGYSTGADSWGDRKYQTVNLQGEFEVARDVTIAAGACVNLIPGHSNDPGVFTSTSLATTSSKTIYVDGVLNISIPEGDAEGTDIVVDVPIVVRTGGVLNVYQINGNAKVVFKKTVTVNSNGSWKMHPSSNVELFAEAHYCNGKFTIDGTSENPVVFTGRRVIGQTTARGSFVEGRGNGAVAFPWRRLGAPSTSAYTHFQIKYGLCKDAYFDMRRIESPVNLKELDHSTFERTVGYDKKYPLMHIENPLSYDPLGIDQTNPPSYVHKFDVDECLFIDKQSLNPVTAYQYRNVGLSVWSASRVNVTNSTFDSFLTGVVLYNNLNFKCQASTFVDNNHGLLVIGTSGIECTSNFAGNEFSSVTSATSEVDYHSNTYDDCRVGIGVYTGGRHWLRDNLFEVYAAGLQNHAATTYLRDRVIGGDNDEYEFGRNDFMSPDDEFIVWNGQLMVTDINVGRGAQLFVDCGYNDFTDYSAYHVYSDGSVADVNASNNRWQNGTGYAPVLYQIGYTGAPLNVQGDVDETCGLVEIASNCEPVSCVYPDIDYPGLTEINSSVYSRIATLQSDVFNAGIGINCRRNLAWEYFQAVAHTDSVTLYAQLKSDMQTIAANSSLPSAFRSQALALKAKTHRLLEELDSARAVFNLVLSTYANEADSIPSNWNLKVLDAMQDTTGHFDSLYKVFNERVLLDLRRPQGSGGFSKSSTPSYQRASSNNGWLSFNSIQPNPSPGSFVVSIQSSQEMSATIDVIAVSGGVASSVTVKLEAGTNTIPIEMQSPSSGLYIVRCSSQDLSIRIPLTLVQ